MLPEIMKKILPSEISSAADKLNTQALFELRLRTERPLSVNYGGAFYYLGSNGFVKNSSSAIVCQVKHIKDILVRATEYSLYAVNNQICQGYLTIQGGIRIGIAGETVWNEDSLKTIKNYNALNIRIPHEVTGCAEKVIQFMGQREIKNTLFISPPGAGKTTLLRDTARILGSSEPYRNILVIDERNEIAAMNDGKMLLNVGINTDVMNGCNKTFAFTRVIRAMRPDIIITDELFDGNDVAAVAYAVSSGVKVIASVHAADHLDLLNKPGFADLIKKKLFGCFVNISDRHGPGTIDGVFDENFNAVYYP